MKQNSKSQAGAKADSSTKDQDMQVSQHRSKPNVVGIPLSQRELKFRAWDLIEKCQVKLTGISFHTNEAVVELYGVNTIVELSKLIIQQYTGLTDTAGDEIYEGDIIKYTEHKRYMLSNFTAVVSYYVSGWAYKRVTGSYEGFTPFSTHDELELDVLPFVEVIGNVFENPELLEGVQ